MRRSKRERRVEGCVGFIALLLHVSLVQCLLMCVYALVCVCVYVRVCSFICVRVRCLASATDNANPVYPLEPRHLHPPIPFYYQS